MTTLMAAHNSHRPAPSTTTALKSLPTSRTSTASKSGDCCSREVILTNSERLQECPTKVLLLTPPPTAVNLPVDDDHHHPTPSHAVVDSADDDEISAYLTKWGDRNDEDFDYSSELDAIVEACKHMQRRSTTTMDTPTIPSNATIPIQQSPIPTPQQCNHNDEDLDFSSVIDALVDACNRMQQQWPSVTTTVAPPPPPTEPAPE